MKKTTLLPNKSKKVTIIEKKHYQRIIGSIMFLIVETRFDIAYVTLVVSCFTKNLSYLYNKAVKTIFYDLKAIRDVKITYGGEYRRNQIIKGYFDFNWVSDYITKKSTSVFIFMLNGRLIS